MNKWLLKRRIHSSWQVAVLCVGLLLGVFTAQYIRISDTFVILALFLSCASALFCFWKQYLYLMIVLILCGFAFGLSRGSMIQADLDEYKPLYGKSVSLKGSVKDDVDIDSSGQIIIKLDQVTINGNKLAGTLWATTGQGDIKRDDEVEIHGKLKEGFGSFSGVMYRASLDKIIHPTPGDIARQARDWFVESIKRSIPEPEASLGIGYLVGQRQALPADLITALQVVGLTHVVVASGYNLTILVRLSRRLFIKISKYLSVLASGLMIVSFIAIAGASPSMVRAGLVSGLSLLAWYYGRKFHPVVLLLFVMAITVIINPSYIWGDLGWQLSFAAFAGVMILAPLLRCYLFGNKKPSVIGQILLETISAQIMTMPIIVMSFGQLSNVAIISNLLVLPFVPLAMLLTFVAGVGGLALPTLATYIGLPAKWLLSYMIGVVNYLAALPWAMSMFHISWWMLFVGYFVIAAGCFYMWRMTGASLRDSNLIG